MPALISLVAKILPLLAILSGSARLDRPLYVGGTDYLYQYDDGTAWWITWEGLYRGTWFDLEDWIYGYCWGTTLWDTEYWFYHESSYPWDTGSFYAELYNGDEAGPVTQLDQTSVLAMHYSPCGVDFGSGLMVEPDFWLLVNTEMSAGGWPSLLGDNTPRAVDHSFSSDDFVAWEPWVIQGPTANDFLIRTDGYYYGYGLNPATWGSIKTLF